MRPGRFSLILAATVSLVFARNALPVPPEGPDKRARADGLLEMAGTQTDLGNYDEARRHAEEAAALYQELSDRRAVGAAWNRSALASIYAGDYSRAERSLDQAIEASTQAGDQEGLAEQLGNRGNVDFFAGRYADAAALYERALGVARSSLEPWANRRQRILVANQASLFQRLGRYTDALALYRELGLAAGSLAPSENAQLLVNEGALFRRLGDPVKALETYGRAVALFRKDRNIDGELGALKNRGIVLAQDLGRGQEGEAAFTAALAIATAAENRREMLHARLYRGEALLQRRAPEKARADFAAALDLARRLETPEEEWKALYGLGRTESSPASAAVKFTEAIVTIERIRGDLRVPSLRPDFLNDKRDVYDALLATHMAGPSADVVFEILEQAHSRDWRDRLGLPSVVELGQVQAALKDGVLLLDYWSSGAGSAVVAITRSRAKVFRLDVDAEVVKQLIDSLAAGASRTWHEPAQRLSSLLPPLEWFHGIRHVVVISDGVIGLVPFEVLSLEDRPLIEHAAVSYLPTAAAVLRPPAGKNTWMWPWEVVLEAFGDPAFTASRLDDTPRLRGRLAATRDEVDRIARQLAGKSVVHIGPDDRKQHLEEARDRPPILHLATHAFADASAMEQSRILFSPRAGGAEADYLFLKEAYGLCLKGVELAVLSACETERGPYLRGEGVQSFSRAFLAAGASSTITTLWRVADAPTADFMEIFYFHVQRGATRDEALRRAKLRFMSSGTGLANPHYWAAFVLSGDATRPVPRAISWRFLVFAGLSLAVLSTLALVRARLNQPPSSKPGHSVMAPSTNEFSSP